MDNRTLIRVTDSLKKQRNRKKWHKVVGFMGVLVLAATVAALVIPASTLAKEPVCGLAEHIHNESCYTETSVLTCGLEETAPHAHTDACYEESRTLVCGMEESEEHSHTDSCYAVERVLACGQEETEGHTHSDACYTTEQMLSCKEIEHTHTEACYEPEKAGKAESSEEASASAEEAELLQGDPTADVESRADWEATLSGVTLTGNWAKDVLAIADSQLGYQESSRNFITNEDGKQKGYSRYGAWYGDAYGDWCAMFASFCLYYADIPTDQMPEEASCPRWIYLLASEKRYASAGKYDPRPGDLIFFDGDQDGTSDHVGIVYASDANGKLRTIEGNSNDMVQYVTYDLGDPTIMGYGILPENPEMVQETATASGQSYYYEDDTIGAAVTLPEGTDVPADAQLRVTPITETNDDYDTLAEQAESAASGETSEIALYDISFYTEDDEYIPVSDQAQVALWFKETLTSDADQSIEVLHFDENEEAPVALEQVEATKDTDDNVSFVTFETPGFSVFAVVTVKGSSTSNDNEVYYRDLDGKSFAIVASNYALTAEASGSGLKGLAVETATYGGTSYVQGDNVPLWTFTKATSNTTYYISTEVDGTIYYLNLSANELTVSTTQQAITAGYSGTSLRLNITSSRRPYYVNQNYGNFRTSASATNLQLSQVPENVIAVYDLDLETLAQAHSLTTTGGIYLPANWSEEPSLTNTVTQLSDGAAGTLETVNGRYERNGRFIWYDNRKNDAFFGVNNANGFFARTPEDTAHFSGESKAWGKEFEFVGWQTTDVNGDVCLFKEDARYTANSNDKTFTVTDRSGTERTLPFGTVFTAKFREFSDLVMFFVNYGGTILDVTGDVGNKTGKGLWTPTLIVGHVYNGTLIVGDSDSFGVQADQDIRALVRNAYDPNDTGVQIVIDGMITAESTTATTASYQAVDSANTDALREHILAHLRQENTPTLRLLSMTQDSGNKELTVTKDHITSENYAIRWYVLKENTDGWHVDGVMVAKSESLRVTKQFHGLTEAQETTILQNDTKFGIQASLQKTNGNVNYFDITADNKTDAAKYSLYQYEGKTDGRYQWTVNMVKDEPYVFTEHNYDIDGYDCTSVVTIRYKDGTVERKLENTVSVANIDVEKVESIAFDNFYTTNEEGKTGMLYINKYAIGADDDNKTLAGADFSMTLSGNGEERTATSDSYGVAFFNNLKPGEYTLKETKAPTGFVMSEETWTIKVGTNTDEITVTDTTGKVLYDSTKGFLEDGLPIGNQAATDTLTVVKNFERITAEQVQKMENYQIVLSKDGKDVVLTLGGVTRKDGGSSGSVSNVNGLKYTWQIPNMEPGTYTVTEKNYLPESMEKDTMVSVGVAQINSKTELGDVTTNSKEDRAEFTVTLHEEQNNAFAITNTYITDFTLKINKVDKDGNETKPLAGASFEIYGLFEEAAVGETKTVSLDGRTYYYMGVTDETGDDGIVTYAGNSLHPLKLGRTYVVVESKQPDGYLLDATPISTGVVNRDNLNYSNGVYTMTVENSKNFTIEVEKHWEGEPQASVTMHLWRSPANGNVGMAEEIASITLTAQDKWKDSWQVPLYDENNNQYAYFVVEDYVDGYSASYKDLKRDVLSDGTSAAVVPLTDVISGKNLTTKVAVTNIAGRELPHTGGAGTLWFTFGGLALLMMAIYIFIKPRRRREAD